MSLDLSRLEKLKRRGDSYEARCPACAEGNADKTGNHLVVHADGRFGCAVHSDPEHRKRIFALVGAVADSATSRGLRDLRPLSMNEAMRIAETRHWPLWAGIEIAVKRGLVWRCDLRDGPGDPVPCWAITDSARRVTQARRLDGKPFSHRRDKTAKTWHACTPFKAKTIGRPAGWPVGAPDIGDRRAVLITEGSTDFLAAFLISFWFGVSADVGVVAMLGSGQSIPDDAAQYFTGKNCRILIDNDAPGEDAAVKWAAQLYRAGAANVSGFRWHGFVMPDGKPVKDASDFASTLDEETKPSADPLEGLLAPTEEIEA